jgi:hypothetical protein
MPKLSRNVKTHKKPVGRGLALYQTAASPYWYARIWLPAERRYLVRSTKERSRLAAQEAAEEIVSDLQQGKRLDRVSRDRAFEFFAEKMLENDERASGQSLHRLTARNERSILYREPDGVLAYLGRIDVGSVRTPNVRDYLNWVDDHRDKPLSASTKSKHITVIRKVLRTAYEAGAVDSIAPMPKVPRRDNPRDWFDDDEYERLLLAARGSAKEGIKVRGVPITMELYYFIVFLVHSFLRPSENEVFALKHRDIRLRDDPRSLQLRVEKPKTKNAILWSDTTAYAPDFYDHLKALHPDYKPTDYVFLPGYPNRTTAKRVFENQFNYLLERAGLGKASGGPKHTVYSLRHTAICKRILHSKGKVNLLNLAKNARTSVAQIERFYSSQLPMDKEMVKNLQTFGD